MTQPPDRAEALDPAIQAAESGGPEAFETLMRRHERLVLATALRLLGNMEDARDASQDVFLRLYRNLGKLRDCHNLAGWLYRVTVNVCHDIRRRYPEEAPVEAHADLASPAADPQQTATRNERQKVLEMSLRMLTAKERAALVLRDLEGLPAAEVAEILGASQATVRSQILQARIKIKGFVEGYFQRRGRRI
jgi:RNA polymerase sigma-70 factor (ECF subfamily)